MEEREGHSWSATVVQHLPTPNVKDLFVQSLEKKHTHLHTFSWWHHTSSVRSASKLQREKQSHVRVCGESKLIQQAE